jgi:ribosomal protein S3
MIMPKLLHEDLKIRKFIKEELPRFREEAMVTATRAVPILRFRRSLSSAR